MAANRAPADLEAADSRASRRTPQPRIDHETMTVFVVIPLAAATLGALLAVFVFALCREHGNAAVAAAVAAVLAGGLALSMRAADHLD